jgi:HAD superfamily hydrolase (TIGR01509 family)
MMGRSPLDSVELFCRELNISEDPRQLLARRDAEVFARFSRDVQAMPGMREALDKFRPKYKLAIATSATRRFVDLVMERLQIRDYFEVLQTSEDVLEGKPAPEIYLKAMSKLGVVPAGSVVLEDSSNGALAGKRSGAYTIAVPSQYTRLQDFSFVDFRAGDLRQAAAHVAAIDFPGGSA